MNIKRKSFCHTFDRKYYGTQSETENDDVSLEAPLSAINVHGEIIDAHTNKNIINSTNTENFVDKPT